MAYCCNRADGSPDGKLSALPMAMDTRNTKGSYKRVAALVRIGDLDIEDY